MISPKDFDFKDAGQAWKNAMAVSLCVLVASVVKLVSKAPELSKYELLIMSSCAVVAAATILAFAVGDLGVINLMRKSLRMSKDAGAYRAMREKALWHCFLIGGHGVIILFVAWFSANDPNCFFGSMAALAAINMCWLAQALQDLDNVRVELDRNSWLWTRLRSCQRAMNVWLRINGVYLLASFFVTSTFPEEARIPALLALTGLRTICDLWLSWSYYTSVTLGDFDVTDSDRSA